VTVATADLSAVVTEARPVSQPGPRRRWGLRRRILLMFTLGALMLSLLLAFITYGLARSSVVQQRDEAARDVARNHASIVSPFLRANPADANQANSRLVNDLGVERPLILYNGAWTPGGVGFDEGSVPQALQDRVVVDGIASRMVVEVDKELYIIVGFPIQTGAAYFEFFSLDDVTSTLGSVRLSLILGTIITTTLGIAAGSFAARRAVRPVGVAAQAAKAIAGGRLDTRLELTEDPDLSALATSFNDMASALESRIERDARFASDVSHELRSPLMTLSASLEVMEARRDEMPERAQSALDLLKADVVRFQGLVEDLLEISRFDAGAVRLHTEELLAAEFVRQAVRISSLPETPVDVSERSEMVLINGDRRRLARVVANLIDNARIHGDGVPEVSIRIVDADDKPVTRVRIAVEDHGAGVPETERSLIFERFARGGVAGRRAGNDGAGLGLSLVDEHVRMHGGRVWVEDRLDGEQGARFVIELDAEELDE
jgi:two-component system, OmpR family, sensor histidine kinase MtrB